MPYYLITFSNTHTAMSTQKILTGKIKFCIMPTLREISHSCGISIRIDVSVLPIKDTIKEAALPLFQLMEKQHISSNMYQIFYVAKETITEL